jgi:hypothetical protein
MVWWSNTLRGRFPLIARRPGQGCPAAVIERRFTQRAPTRHPGHVDHVLDAQLKAALDGGVGPLGLDGPVLEVDTSGPIDLAAVATWIRQQPEWYAPAPSQPAHNPTRR